jgi:hypothetical protein
VTEVARGDVGAIKELQTSLSAFLADATDAAQQSDRLASDAVAKVLAEVGKRRAALAAAEAALEACQRDPEADCSGLQREVERAAARLATAEGALRAAERACSEFQPRQARFTREAQRLVGEGRQLLGRMAEDLETYLAVAGGGEFLGGASGAAAAPSTPPPTPGLPDGWAMVPLGLIDTSDSSVTGPESFGKGYTSDDLAWAFETLHEVVLPALAYGHGADYFQQRDLAEGRYGTRSYSDTYSGFFKDSSAIKLEPRPDGTYSIGNGYHRVWVAQRLGLDTVPGQVR